MYFVLQDAALGLYCLHSSEQAAESEQIHLVGRNRVNELWNTWNGCSGIEELPVFE